VSTKLTHVRLLSPNVHRLADFYRERFGFEVTLDISEGFYVELAAGDVVLAIYERNLMDSITGATPPGPGDRAVLCIAVDDVDASYRELAAAGAHSVAEPHDRAEWFLRVAHVRDPEGNLIELNKSTYTADVTA
jgi:lactoylglutathione lyase